jgi:poly(A) polymerase
MGRGPVSDLDLAVAGDVEEVARRLVEEGQDFSNLVFFGQFRTAKLSFQSLNLELTQLRSEDYVPNSRKPQTRFGSIKEDAFRRDFTVNAIYKDVKSGELLDPTGQGLSDLKSKILRTIH